MRILRGGVCGPLRDITPGSSGILLASASSRAAHLRGCVVSHRQPGALLSKQLEGTTVLPTLSFEIPCEAWIGADIVLVQYGCFMIFENSLPFS